MNLKKIFTVFFLSFFISAANAAEPYFAGDSISPTLIDPPFVQDSAEWKEELNYIIKLQRKFNLQEIDQALDERKLRPENVAQFVDPTLTREKNPKLYRLLDRVEQTSRNVTDNFKNHWQETRPYLVDKRVKVLITPSEGFSYPSGHATGSFIYAHVLSLLMPQKQQEFEDRAEKIAKRRQLVGMHFPKDLVGGKQLSLLVVGGLTQNKDFQKDLKAAKKEFEKE